MSRALNYIRELKAEADDKGSVALTPDDLVKLLAAVTAYVGECVLEKVQDSIVKPIEGEIKEALGELDNA